MKILSRSAEIDLQFERSVNDFSLLVKGASTKHCVQHFYRPTADRRREFQLHDLLCEYFSEKCLNYKPPWKVYSPHCCTYSWLTFLSLPPNEPNFCSDHHAQLALIKFTVANSIPLNSFDWLERALPAPIAGVRCSSCIPSFLLPCQHRESSTLPPEHFRWTW